MAAIQARETACAPFLKSMGGNPTQALKLALVDPPYATKTESVKVASCDLVCKALLMIKVCAPVARLAWQSVCFSSDIWMPPC